MSININSGENDFLIRQKSFESYKLSDESKKSNDSVK